MQQSCVLFPSMCTPAWSEKVYTARSLSCLSAGFFVLKASVVILICACVGAFCYFSSFITPWKGKSIHCYQHIIFSWLMLAVQQVHDHFPTSLPYLSSPSTFMFIPLFLGLVGVSPLKDAWGRLTNCLLDWLLRSSPKTDSVLST